MSRKLLNSMIRMACVKVSFQWIHSFLHLVVDTVQIIQSSSYLLSFFFLSFVVFCSLPILMLSSSFFLSFYMFPKQLCLCVVSCAGCGKFFLRNYGKLFIVKVERKWERRGEGVNETIRAREKGRLFIL